MTILLALNIVGWFALLLWMVPASYNAVFGKTLRRGDPMRLSVLTVSSVMLGFCARRLFIPESDFALKALYVLNLAVVIHIAFLARAYGRGPNVGS
jgi:hypothetical protein